MSTLVETAQEEGENGTRPPPRERGDPSEMSRKKTKTKGEGRITAANFCSQDELLERIEAVVNANKPPKRHNITTMEIAAMTKYDRLRLLKYGIKRNIPQPARKLLQNAIERYNKVENRLKVQATRKRAQEANRARICDRTPANGEEQEAPKSEPSNENDSIRSYNWDAPIPAAPPASPVNENEPVDCEYPTAEMFIAPIFPSRRDMPVRLATPPCYFDFEVHEPQLDEVETAENGRTTPQPSSNNNAAPQQLRLDGEGQQPVDRVQSRPASSTPLSNDDSASETSRGSGSPNDDVSDPQRRTEKKRGEATLVGVQLEDPQEEEEIMTEERDGSDGPQQPSEPLLEVVSTQRQATPPIGDDDGQKAATDGPLLDDQHDDRLEASTSQQSSSVQQDTIPDEQITDPVITEEKLGKFEELLQKIRRKEKGQKRVRRLSEPPLEVEEEEQPTSHTPVEPQRKERREEIPPAANDNDATPSSSSQQDAALTETIEAVIALARKPRVGSVIHKVPQPRPPVMPTGVPNAAAGNVQGNWPRPLQPFAAPLILLPPPPPPFLPQLPMTMWTFQQAAQYNAWVQAQQHYQMLLQQQMRASTSHTNIAPGVLNSPLVQVRQDAPHAQRQEASMPQRLQPQPSSTRPTANPCTSAAPPPPVPSAPFPWPDDLLRELIEKDDEERPESVPADQPGPSGTSGVAFRKRAATGVDAHSGEVRRRRKGDDANPPNLIHPASLSSSTTTPSSSALPSSLGDFMRASGRTGEELRVAEVMRAVAETMQREEERRLMRSNAAKQPTVKPSETQLPGEKKKKKMQQPVTVVTQPANSTVRLGATMTRPQQAISTSTPVVQSLPADSTSAAVDIVDEEKEKKRLRVAELARARYHAMTPERRIEMNTRKTEMRKMREAMRRKKQQRAAAKDAANLMVSAASAGPSFAVPSTSAAHPLPRRQQADSEDGEQQLFYYEDDIEFEEVPAGMIPVQSTVIAEQRKMEKREKREHEKEACRRRRMSYVLMGENPPAHSRDAHTQKKINEYLEENDMSLDEWHTLLNDALEKDREKEQGATRRRKQPNGAVQRRVDELEDDEIDVVGN